MDASRCWDSKMQHLRYAMDRTRTTTPEDRCLGAAQVPRAGASAHVGIIMDGNGRWAAARGLPRLEGHRRGVEALRRAVRAAIETSASATSPSTASPRENWTRPVEEVSDLMGLLKRFIRNDLADLHRNGVRVRIIGERDGLKPDIRALLREAENLTATTRA